MPKHYRVGCKIISIVGARPQFIKLASFCHAVNLNRSGITHIIIHTGQHYDCNMSRVFFSQLQIPNPKYHLEIGSGSHGQQTGAMLHQIEAVLLKEKPDWVVVYGDTNSTLAGALAAKKLNIPLAHVEAGLRSHNRTMPEEINRVVTDHCSDILFCPTQQAVVNLKNEGFSNIVNNGRLISHANNFPKRNLRPLVLNVGDIMLDSLQYCLKLARHESTILEKLKISPKSFYLGTIHRAQNTDNEKNLVNILKSFSKIALLKPVIFPLHPRTRNRLKKLKLNFHENLRFIDPVNYFDMLMLEQNASKILTDSGGVQKEAFFLKVPCITLRDETEWKETLLKNANQLVGINTRKIVDAVFRDNKACFPKTDFYGKGAAASLILDVLCHAQ